VVGGEREEGQEVLLGEVEGKGRNRERNVKTRQSGPYYLSLCLALDYVRLKIFRHGPTNE
jgi:hypothetical protein